uniref:DNRLRE domain-containing protein n=1 Tax=Brevibacillus reuszeri TaxID=54915 RepID=UPI0013E09210
MPVVTLSKANSVTRDNEINTAVPSGSYPSGNPISVGRATSITYRELLFFDLGLIPNDAIINSASLKLRKSGGSAVAYPIGVHKVTSPWTNAVTWNTQPSFNDTPDASPSIGGNANTDYTIDIKALVQAWVSGEANNGMLLKFTDETISFDRFHSFYSFEDGTVVFQPTLTIDYTIPTTGKKQVEYVGAGTPAYTSGSTTATAPVPTGASVGDLVVAHFAVSTTAAVTLPSGWTLAKSTVNGVWQYVIAYKKIASGDGAYTFRAPTALNWNMFTYAFRNVANVLSPNSAAFSGVSSVKAPSTSVTASKTAFVLMTMNDGNNNATPPLSYNELADAIVSAAYGSEVSMRYMHNLLSQANTDMQTNIGFNCNGVTNVFALEPITNNPPTLTLTSPADNQTL